MRFIIGALVAIGAFILLIVIIIKLIFGGGGTPQQQLDLNNYANTATEMQLTVDGPVNAAQNHRQIQITVGRDENTIEIIRGYQDDVINRKSYASSADAYNAFLHALTIVGYNQGSNAKVGSQLGHCPLGQRYIFAVINPDGKEIQHYWATSCGGSGNYKGSVDTTLSLFQAQIPDFDDLTSNLDI